MIDRDALEAALANWKHAEKNWTNGIIEAAARQALSQLPKTCDECDGRGTICYPHEGISHVASSDEGCLCPSCLGSGKVYEPELVERLSETIAKSVPLQFVPYTIAIAVLDAINGISE